MVRYPMLNFIMATQIFVRIILGDSIVAVPKESSACLKYTLKSSSACCIDFKAI